MTRILVTGHEGLLGSNLVALGCTPFVADLTDMHSIRAGITPAYAIINCAAKTNVDWCETYPASSSEVNVMGVQRLIETLQGLSGSPPLLVHISTDFIANGDHGPYTEESITPNPLNVYGAQKWFSEIMVRNQYPKHLIIRTTMLYGAHKSKFTFVHWLLSELSCHTNQIGVTYKQVTTPTYAPDLARIILTLVKRGMSGTFHVTSGETYTRFQFAIAVAKEFGYPQERIMATHHADQTAVRPQNGGLFVRKLDELGIVPQKTLESIKELKQNWK